MRWVFRIISYTVFIAFILMLGIIIFSGIVYFTKPGFFTQYPRSAMSEGGIFPMLIGSLLLMVVVFLVSIPTGLLGTIFITEFAPRRFSMFLQSLAATMNSIPSIVYGLFGLSLFCVKLSLGTSLISASLTLSTMAIPFFINSAAEFLRAVPKELREGVVALGANKFQATLMVLRASKNGLLTALLLTLGRAFSETAPILVTGAVFYATQLPRKITDPVMTLPTSIYAIVMNLGEKSQWMAKAMSSLMVIVMILTYSIVQFLRRHRNE
ncbi:MAG: phosphate ABC transporter permease PstA [Pseudothermotoga sp.]